MSLKEFFFGFSDETRAAFPNLFINHNIDRHQCRRVVPMEVLSLGMGRTGTTSMAAAFALLGFPTSHGGADMHSNPLDGDIWLEAVKAKYQGDTSVKLDASFFDKALGHVSAWPHETSQKELFEVFQKRLTTAPLMSVSYLRLLEDDLADRDDTWFSADYPSNMFGPELIAAYPNAKVVLVERDADAWYPSFERALIRGQDLPAWFRHFLELADNTQKHVQPVIWRGMMQGQFGAKDSIEWRKKAKDVYERHNAEIREVLKDQPERLLVYRLGSGWEPLCEFLGKPIPDVDFPRVNEKAQHDAMIKVFIVQQLQSFLLNMTKTGGAALVAVIAWRWWSQSPSA
ncbi:hypothetical protein TruAng_008986 [Truncatella angustata]|nr:hypothetical protein TruAng_008986 [Truncatella angustata]